MKKTKVLTVSVRAPEYAEQEHAFAGVVVSCKDV